MAKKKKPENSAQEVVATQEEITKAFESLSDAQLLKLKKYAQWRIGWLGNITGGMTAANLIADAILGTLEENGRNWYKERVDFPTHLFGAIKSISRHIREKYERQEGSVDWAYPVVNEEGKEIDPLQDVPSEKPNPERAFEIKEQIGKIKGALNGKELDLEVLNGLLSEMKGPEIQEILSLSQTEYETVIKRIYRTARKILI